MSRLSNLTLPRVRGRVGKIEECPGEPEIEGKWTWNIQIYTVGKNMRATVRMEIEGHAVKGRYIFDTEEQAKASLEAETKKVVGMIQDAAGGGGGFQGMWNLKTGEWVKP